MYYFCFLCKKFNLKPQRSDKDSCEQSEQRSLSDSCGLDPDNCDFYNSFDPPFIEKSST